MHPAIKTMASKVAREQRERADLRNSVLHMVCVSPLLLCHP